MSLVRMLAGVGVGAWIASAVLVVVCVEAPGNSLTGPLLAFTLTLAATASASAVVLRVVLAPYLSWQRGIEYGRLLERERLSGPVPRSPRLRSVP